MKYRADIDGLRAIAVLTVVLYHFKNNIGFNGYMGVDIFFVISGYLITKIIYDEAKQGHFSIKEFYNRRVKRIMPAMMLIVSVSTLMALLLFLPKELVAFSKSAIASIFFSANILFYSEAGYFDADAILKPLLHMWSLSVEEQFYIFFPLIIYAVAKYKIKHVYKVIFALLALSFLSNFILIRSDSNALSFFMFPMRAWELLCGALIAVHCFTHSKENPLMLNVIALLGATLVVVGFSLDVQEEATSYFLYMMPAVIGTTLLLYAGQGNTVTWVGQFLSNRVFNFFGKISYSLYLWHWPILVFGVYSFPEMTKHEKLLLIVLPVILAYLSWRYVEQPFRQKSLNVFTKRNVSILLSMVVSLTLTNLYVVYKEGYVKDYDPLVKSILAVELGGDYNRYGQKSNYYFGKEGEPVTVLLMGDSHATAISPALHKKAIASEQGALMLRNECYVTDASRGTYNNDGCVSTTQEHIDYIKAHPEIKVVVIAQRWKTRTENFSKKYNVQDDIYGFRQKSLIDFIKKIERPNLSIIVLGPVPVVREKGNNLRLLYVRDLMAKKDVSYINPIKSDFLKEQADVMLVLKEVTKQTNAKVIWPHAYICDEIVCDLHDGQGFYYWDDDHLSSYAAEKFSYMFDGFIGNVRNGKE